MILWPVSVAAQALIAPFGDDIWETGKRTWTALALLCFFGVMVRVLVELQAGKVRRPFRAGTLDIAVIAGVGTISGLVMFGICESVSGFLWRTTGHKLPDFLVAAAIATAAYKKWQIMDAFSLRLKRHIDSGNSLDGR